ncbi:MAG: hypothetical protein IJV06_03880 [Bacteroidaceae bacterium]|nr:hypothetical protein [Bacteroidaceae bacterium]
MKKQLLMGLLTLLPTAATIADAQEATPYTVVKVSNPDRGEREVDGLIAGGDRENSYTWRLAMRGDEIYIATTRNIASALVNMYAPAFAAGGLSVDAFWDMINLVSNGDIPRNDANEGANIISYNRKTGEFKVIYTAESAVYFRMAVTYGDNVYFGSYTARPDVGQYILRLDPQGNFTKVFQTTGSVSLRANCVYDDHLFFAGADAREEVAEGQPVPTKMAILRKSNEDDTQWDRVADYKDFGVIPYDGIMSSWAGAPFWELASHNGYIYATAPSTPGFVIFRGRPAQDGEEANEYGWHWEEVAGLNNGINNPGLSDIVGGEPGTMRSLIGSVYEYKGQLFAYNFDHSFGGEAQAFAGIIQQLTGADVKASDYLYYMYNSLQNPQKIWRLNDETGKFEECKNFTKYMENTTNEYIWRMGEYDDQLYIATMDAGIFYGYLTQLTNGNFLLMTPEERVTKIQYLDKVIKSLLATASSKIDPAAILAEKLGQIKSFLQGFLDKETVSPEALQELQSSEAIAGEIETAADDPAISESDPELGSKLRQFVADLRSKIDMKGIVMYNYINNIVVSSDWGFDLFRTSDAENFEVITRTGFNDKYNYGCPSFLATEEGLYIGTCNPFYGGQLYLLTNQKDQPGDDDATAINQLPAQAQPAGAYYTLSGQRINGQPTAPGIYIQNGRKVLKGFTR